MTSAALHRPMFGESGYERNALDAYWTPEWCTNVLLDHVELRGLVWEPACGLGHIVKALHTRSYRVLATDIEQHGELDFDFSPADFFAFNEAHAKVGSIVTNPPYADADRFIRHALQLMAPSRGQVAMLLRNEFDCAAGRVDLFGPDYGFAGKLVLTRRPKWSADDKASPRHNFAWFIWDWTHRGDATLRHQRRSR